MIFGLPVISVAIWLPIVFGLLVLATGGDKNAPLARILALVGSVSEALAAELRLAAQRLLGDERVRADAPRVDLLVHEVVELQHVHHAHGDVLVERLAGAAVE